jgi:hypothetical protein
MVSQSNFGGYMISFDSLANYSSSLEANTTNMSILIPARHSSLKTLFTIVRLQENIGAITKSTISERVNIFGDTGQWYFSIGGKNIPSTPAKTNTEAAAELCKALHAFGAQSHTNLINRSTWTAANGIYIITADLERQPHKSRLSESGINTLSTNTYLIGQFTQTTKAINIQTFDHYDGILVIHNGICSV